MYDQLWTGAHVATMKDGHYNTIERAALAVKDGQIAWLGSLHELPEQATATDHYEVDGKWITPGLIDSHTHLVFGGNRADEFEKRLQGESYEEIARQGGGILSTVRHTREATEEELIEDARHRLETMMAEGVTTIEIKSGYGLNTANELKMLRVARRLGDCLPLRVQTTFLGAHALHPDYNGNRQAYLELIREEMLPLIAEQKLADATDAFCEHIAFTLEEVSTIFTSSLEWGLPVKLHADQLSDGGGAALAAEFAALSADHLEYTGETGIKAMADAGTVAVLLPGAWYSLREKKLPDVALFRRYGTKIAIATDCNPGSSPVLSLQTMITMAATSFRLTPEEALAGVTCHAAQALGLGDQVGTLETGKSADFVVWNFKAPAELAYWMGTVKPERVVYRGKLR